VQKDELKDDPGHGRQIRAEAALSDTHRPTCFLFDSGLGKGKIGGNRMN
jgi:hypothetical protein